MTYPCQPNEDTTVQQLREENHHLQSELDQIQCRAEVWAQADADAAELVAQLDETHESWQREIDRRMQAEYRLQSVSEYIRSEVQQQLISLQKANDDLTREVADCPPEEREQTQLLRQLEEVNRQLTEFATIVSHDLKAPLRGIKSLASWILLDCCDRLDATGQQNLNLLMGRVDRMESLVNGMLSYSRAGCGAEPCERVDLDELLPHIIDAVSPPESIAVTVQDSLPSLHCERTRVTQVFQNLISNAVKNMDKPQGHIAIAHEDQGDQWVFRVVDNGPGVAECHHEAIFEVFQTLAPCDETENSGIGLAVVRKVVGLYGGRVWLTSTVGEGSTFYFSWPKDRDAVDFAGDVHQD